MRYVHRPDYHIYLLPRGDHRQIFDLSIQAYRGEEIDDRDSLLGSPPDIAQSITPEYTMARAQRGTLTVMTVHSLVLSLQA